VSREADGRAVVVWDSDCTFCRRWASRWYGLTGNAFAWGTVESYSDHLTIDRKTLATALHVVEPDGSTVHGAEAVFTIQARGGVRRWPLWLYRNLPGFNACTEAGYRWVANHRSFADQCSRALLGKVEIPDTWLLTRRVFLRCMGLIWLAAFLSLGPQLPGLIGESGLSSVSAWLNVLGTTAPDVGLLSVPTFQWFGGDGLLQATWIIGALAAAGMVLGLAPIVCAATCWLTWLSLVTASGIFTGYQWDALLLEIGLLAIMWSPWAWRLNAPHVRAPSKCVRWVLVLVLVKLVFLSGWVKLQSGDGAWASDTSLQYHFWTQPLPWWPAWIAASAPTWLLSLLSKGMFFVELWAVWLLVLPRVPRLIAAIGIVLLQLGIAATGNYGYFNWLAIVLCLIAVDDAMLLLLWPSAIRYRFAAGLRAVGPLWRRSVVGVACVFVLSLSLTQLPWVQPHMPSVVQRWIATWRPWHVASNYGLFATMTTTRPELIIESSEDGVTWMPYAFVAKPGPLGQPSPFAQPGMPRLDWQLWFDALSYERLWQAGVLRPETAWDQFTNRQVLPSLLQSLAVASPSVLDLLEASPTGDAPPTWLRWSLWRYEFATEGADWWTRTHLFTAPPKRMSTGQREGHSGT
jgi:predicted DCC family thiol-disulfide oxidoreductase YuxK